MVHDLSAEETLNIDPKIKAVGNATWAERGRRAREEWAKNCPNYLEEDQSEEEDQERHERDEEPRRGQSDWSAGGRI